jgi:hypothetical protein
MHSRSTPGIPFCLGLLDKKVSKPRVIAPSRAAYVELQLGIVDVNVSML